jgi:hypothetical protein
VTAHPARRPLGMWLAFIASVVVVAAIAAGILVGGSPAEHRAARLDARRVSDLQRLVRAIHHHHSVHGSVPADLSKLMSAGTSLGTADPETGVAYEYERRGVSLYRVCAIFLTDSSRAPTWAGLDWDHGVGRQCFDRSAKTPE